jgi:N4-gp56 family major capsid protein
MANSTTSTEAELLSEFWNNVFINELRDNLQFEQFGLKNSHPMGSGTTAHWLSLADLSAAAALTEASDPTSYTLSAGDQTAVVKQYGATVTLSDLLQDTWISGSMQTLMERLARNAAHTIDTVIRDTNFTAGGTVQYAGTAVARNSIATDGSFDMDIAEIREAVNTLEGAGVPTYADGGYVGVIHQDVKYDLQGDTANWQEILKHNESTIGTITTGGVGTAPGRGGYIGSMFGVNFMLSQKALKLDASGSASTDVYQSYIFGPEHYGVSDLQGVQTIIKNPAPSSSLDLYGTVGWKAGFATKELDGGRMVRVESGAALGD